MKVAQEAADAAADKKSEQMAASLGAESPELEETQQKVKSKRDKELAKRVSDLTKSAKTGTRKKKGQASFFSGGKEKARRKILKLQQKAVPDTAKTEPATRMAAPAPPPHEGGTATGNDSEADGDDQNDDDLDGDEDDGVGSSDSTGSTPVKKRPARESDGRDKNGPGGSAVYEPP